MIEKSPLPVRGKLPSIGKFFGKGILQTFHPTRKRLIRKRNKQVQVIRHEDVTANKYIFFHCDPRKMLECRVHLVICQQWFSVIRATRYEIDRVTNINPFQSAKSFCHFDFSSNAAVIDRRYINHAWAADRARRGRAGPANPPRRQAPRCRRSKIRGWTTACRPSLCGWNPRLPTPPPLHRAG